MDRIPGPSQLRGAAAVAQSLAYVAGLAGVVAGATLWRDGDPTLAVVIWVLSFCAGAAMMIAAMLVRAVEVLMGRIARIESDVSLLVAKDPSIAANTPERDQWGHQPPY